MSKSRPLYLLLIIVIIIFLAISIATQNDHLHSLIFNFRTTNPDPPMVTQTPITESNSDQTPLTTATVNEPLSIQPLSNQTEESQPTQVVQFIPENWKDWPIMPVSVSDELRLVYRQGIANGNNPNAFSVLGDCNSEPKVFMGIYDQDSEEISSLDPALQETIQVFSGSFDRYSPTVKIGTTEGALLWAGWNENEEGYCEANETPIDCEIRVHKPVIAFINLGTHFESRNEEYLRILIEKLLDNSTVPIIVTKADNREGDERVNINLINLAIEYDLPVWNFWRSVQDVANEGLREGDDMYMNEEALDLQRIDALKVLDFVHRELQK